MKKEEPPRLREPLALSPKEAAKALGVSERHLRNLLPELPHVHLGNRVVIPIEALRRWLEEQTRIEHSRIDKVVDEVLQGLDDLADDSKGCTINDY